MPLGVKRYNGKAESTALWRVTPKDADYVALGFLASQSGGYDEPDLEGFAYVRRTLVEEASGDLHDLTNSSDTDVPHFWTLYLQPYLTFVAGSHPPPEPLWKLKRKS